MEVTMTELEYLKDIEALEEEMSHIMCMAESGKDVDYLDKRLDTLITNIKILRIKVNSAKGKR